MPVLEGMVHKIQRAPFSEQIAQQIQQLIEQEHLLPGDQLPSERELCEQFGVSRTVIREAVKTLVQSGLLAVEIGRGTFVAQPSARTVADSLSLWARLGKQPFEKLLEVRRALELEIAVLAARRAAPDQIEKMRQALAEMDQGLDDPQVYIRADNDFHIALAEAAHNDLFLILINSIVDLLQESRQLVFRIDGAPRRGQAHHRAILEAIVRQDPTAARQAVNLHLEQVEIELNAEGADLDSCEEKANEA